MVTGMDKVMLEHDLAQAGDHLIQDISTLLASAKLLLTLNARTGCHWTRLSRPKLSMSGTRIGLGTN
jgi:hypothetical protein